MPCGLGSQFQLEKSTLLDAYKKNELVPRYGPGPFSLSSIPVDRPEPAECSEPPLSGRLDLRQSVTCFPPFS